MTSPQGAFYSAEDTDSPNPSGRREEGWFYTWTPEELEAVLGAERSSAVAVTYGIRPGGNFEGRSIPHVARSLEDVARELGRDPAKLRGHWSRRARPSTRREGRDRGPCVTRRSWPSGTA